MRKTTVVLTAAFLALSAVPAFPQTTQPQADQSQKDECLLASRNCMNQVDDIKKRIYKLDREIKKGTRVYTPEELKKLQDKLKETSDVLRTLERPDS